MKRKTLFNLISILSLALVLAFLVGGSSKALPQDIVDKPALVTDQTTLIYGLPARCSADPVRLASPEELKSCVSSASDLTTFVAPANSHGVYSGEVVPASAVVEDPEYIYGLPARCATDVVMLMLASPEELEACVSGE